MADVMQELQALWQFISSDDRMMSWEDLYAAAGQRFALSHKQGLTQGATTKGKAQAQIDALRKLANTEMTSANTALHAKIRKARVAYYAYKVEHFGEDYAKAHVNKNSGFNWERRQAGLAVRTDLGGKDGGPDGPPAAGKAAKGPRRGGVTSPVYSPQQWEQIAEIAEAKVGDKIKVGKDTVTVEDEKQIKQAQQALAARSGAAPRAEALRGRGGVADAGTAAALGKEAKKRGESARYREMGAIETSKEGLGKIQAGVNWLATDLEQGIEKVATFGGATKALDRAFAGKPGVKVPGVKSSEIDRWIAQHPELANKIARGQLTRKQVAEGLVRAKKSAIARQERSVAAAATIATAEEQAKALRTGSGKKVPTGTTAPSLFGVNEAGQSYLQWLRSTSTRPLRASNPASWNPSAGARTEANVAASKPSTVKKYKRKKGAKGAQIGGGR